MIRPYKNLEVILSELEMLDINYRKLISLKICGKSLYDVSATIEGLKNLNLGEFIFVDKFLPEEQFFDELKNFDFLLISHSSSSGSGLISVATSLGIPIIASKIPTFENFIANYECGIIFDQSKNGDLSRVIMNLLSDKKMVNRFKLNAQKTKNLVPTWEDYAIKIIRACDVLTAERVNDK